MRLVKSHLHAIYISPKSSSRHRLRRTTSMPILRPHRTAISDEKAAVAKVLRRITRSCGDNQQVSNWYAVQLSSIYSCRPYRGRHYHYRPGVNKQKQQIKASSQCLVTEVTDNISTDLPSGRTAGDMLTIIILPSNSTVSFPIRLKPCELRKALHHLLACSTSG